MKLGVYIGSFNPVHVGHINVVNYLLENNYVDKTLIIPTMEYWDKNNLAPLKDRINMLRFFENEQVMIDTTHNNYIYTCELMKVLEKEYNDELYLILGADNIINFSKWKDYEELLKYNIIVLARDNIDITTYTSKLDGNFIVVDNYPFINISSTKIRNGNCDEYLDAKVLKYIKDNNLYGRM